MCTRKMSLSVFLVGLPIIIREQRAVYEYWHPIGAQGLRRTPFACLGRKRVVPCCQKCGEGERVSVRLRSLQNFESQILWVGDSHSCKRKKKWAISLNSFKGILAPKEVVFWDLIFDKNWHCIPTCPLCINVSTTHSGSDSSFPQWSLPPSMFIGVLFYLSQLL